jgi:hypothetical protein
VPRVAPTGVSICCACYRRGGVSKAVNRGGVVASGFNCAVARGDVCLCGYVSTPRCGYSHLQIVQLVARAGNDQNGHGEIDRPLRLHLHAIPGESHLARRELHVVQDKRLP